jgi:FMN phosphatase YigB (HAD superfamily)
MPVVRAVLLDWRGTLVVTVPVTRWIERALQQVGRDASAAAVEPISAAFDAALGRPDIQRTWSQLDRSAEAHREGNYRLFAAAGIEPDLADALYMLESDPANNPFATDVGRTLAALKAAGMKVAIVSDIHFDLRPVFAEEGFDGHIDSFVLSFEHGVQKPDPTIFRIALDQLAVTPHEALMVGDRSRYDGAAVEAGIPTLLVPPLTSPSEERLGLVLAACGIAT